MRLFGYEDTKSSPGQAGPLSLSEATLAASPEELRAIARFLAECADRMEIMGSRYDHEHLGDQIDAFHSSPQFIVARG